jgi:hypothetical protein
MGFKWKIKSTEGCQSIFLTSCALFFIKKPHFGDFFFDSFSLGDELQLQISLIHLFFTCVVDSSIALLLDE